LVFGESQHIAAVRTSETELALVDLVLRFVLSLAVPTLVGLDVRYGAVVAAVLGTEETSEDLLLDESALTTATYA
jgi:hypothetical protein